MKTVYSPLHAGHAGYFELGNGQFSPGFEKPMRAEFIHARVQEVGLGPVLAPQAHGIAPAGRVHTADYLQFLSEAWDRWTAIDRHTPALPMVWPIPGLRSDVPPAHIDGLLGFYSLDAGAPIVAGTYKAIVSSLESAITAADIVQAGERAAFALCRPPGHHAGSRFMGGYCYVNNASAAAQRFLDNGAKRVAILDVDYHHGNGTQEIFYARDDVFVANLHGDPLTEYPYLLGHRDETGTGAGEGFNVNYPMPHGTDYGVWGAALDDACTKIAAFAPDAVVVSLGVDTFEKDPISHFKLKTVDYPRIGARIAKLGLPTLFVMEGGYAVAEIAVNAVGVLTGFEGA
ncbi:histone deacetylase family protein [Pseudoxanthobacter sp.]|uniref:histone deacetylase family protein n=1 Tax=Pseudoxanthobacter sp. TaxID=1925742 RepID=UPI002FE04A59